MKFHLPLCLDLEYLNCKTLGVVVHFGLYKKRYDVLLLYNSKVGWKYVPENNNFKKFTQAGERFS